MEESDTFFVAKKQQTTDQIELSGTYVLKGKVLLGEKIKLLIQEMKDPGKIKTRGAKYTLLLLGKSTKVLSSLYKENGHFAFDIIEDSKKKYYKLHIDPEANTAKIERYNLFIL